ncbi:MAG: ribulose-phosphate 3-epimerase [Bacteroidota bacterium]|nr:ribulose-phosphate 3-epimerase [Bacteroidota bacterium]
MSMIIAPSLLAADFANLQRDIETINSSNADWFHVDIMDGSFVPNFSMGIPVVEAIKRHAKLPLDVHLMIVNPEKYIDAFQKAGAHNISVHYEASNHLDRIIHQIKDAGCKAGIAINPHTNINLLEDVIDMLDLVIVMSVNPGFGGQKFIQNTYSRVNKLKNLIIQKNSHSLIEIDGGVNLDNAPLLKKEGADVLVAGNFVFTASNPIQVVNQLKQI